MKKIVNYKYLYWLYIVLLGLIFIFLIPPFQKPDEGYHYNQVLSFVGGIRNFPNFNLPSKIYETEYKLPGTFFSGSIMGQPAGKFPISLYKNFLFVKNNELTNDSLNLNINSLFSYFPSILGYSLNFGFPVFGFYLARIFSFLFFLICIYLASKIVNKKYRNILLIYCCLPMVLQQVTAISYDAVFLSLSPLIFAYFTKFWSESKLKKTYLIKIILLLILISLVKLGNELFLFLILLFPFQKIFLKLTKIKLILIKLFLFVSLISYLFLRTLSTGIVSTDININQTVQRKILFSDPVYVFETGVNTLKVNSDFYINSFLGNFGWLDYHLDWWVYFLIFGLLLGIYVSIIRKNNKNILTWIQILFLGLFVFLNIGLSFSVMYLGWTSAASKVIEGVQGRYFLPIIPFFILWLTELILKIGKERSKKIFFILSVSIIFISVISATYKRYYDYSRLYQNPEGLKNVYELAIKTPKNIEEVLVDKEINIELDVKDKKFSGFQLVTKLPKEKIAIPYKYLIIDDNGNIVQKGYLLTAKMTDNGLYQEEFSIKETNSKKITIKIFPIISNKNEKYFSLLKNKDNQQYFVELLYITK